MGNVLGWTWFANISVAFLVVCVALVFIFLIGGLITEELEIEDLTKVIVVILAMIAIIFTISKIFNWNFYTCCCIVIFVLSILDDLGIIDLEN